MCYSLSLKYKNDLEKYAYSTNNNGERSNQYSHRAHLPDIEPSKKFSVN